MFENRVFFFIRTDEVDLCVLAAGACGCGAGQGRAGRRGSWCLTQTGWCAEYAFPSYNW